MSAEPKYPVIPKIKDDMRINLQQEVSLVTVGNQFG